MLCVMPCLYLENKNSKKKSAIKDGCGVSSDGMGPSEELRFPVTHRRWPLASSMVAVLLDFGLCRWQAWDPCSSFSPASGRL